MSETKPEWADDVDDDEAPTPEPVTVQRDDVADEELAQVAASTPADPAVEGTQGDPS